jgi:hypothetical protein
MVSSNAPTDVMRRFKVYVNGDYMGTVEAANAEKACEPFWASNWYYDTVNAYEVRS